MKKQFNVRLSSEALLAIKVAAKEGGCSEAEVIERWALRPDSATMGRLQTGPEPQPANKRAVFDKLKAMAGDGTLGMVSGVSGVSLAEKDMSEPKPAGPVFPFRVQVGDDIWTVVNRGPKYAYEIEEVGTGGFLPEKKVLELWDKRIQ